MDELQKIVETKDFTDGQMQSIISYFQERLKNSSEQKPKKNEPTDPTKQSRNHESARRKRMLRAEDKILNVMNYTMEKCKAQGFFYGILTEEGNVLTGASDALRQWLHEKVCFARDGLPEIEKFNNRSNNIQLDKNAGPKCLMKMNDTTLGSILSTLVRYCDPPQKKFPLKAGITPPWWPSATEKWWGEAGFPTSKGPPPYKKPHDLKKIWKVGVLVGVIKHLMPNAAWVRSLVRQSKSLQHKMTAKENKVWLEVVAMEEELHLQSLSDDAKVAGGENNEGVSITTDDDEHTIMVQDLIETVNNEIEVEDIVGGSDHNVGMNLPITTDPMVFYDTSTAPAVFAPEVMCPQYYAGVPQFSAMATVNTQHSQSSMPPMSYSMPNTQPNITYNYGSYGMNNQMSMPHFNAMAQATTTADQLAEQTHFGFNNHHPMLFEDFGMYDL